MDPSSLPPMNAKQKIRYKLVEKEAKRTGNTRKLEAFVKSLKTSAESQGPQADAMSLMTDILKLNSIKGRKKKEEGLLNVFKSLPEMEPMVTRMLAAHLGADQFNMIMDNVLKGKDPETYAKLKMMTAGLQKVEDKKADKFPSPVSQVDHKELYSALPEPTIDDSSDDE